MKNTKILSSQSAAAVCDLLQSLVIDLLDLSLQVKQAHWNVQGKHFMSVHEQLDAIHATLLGAIDEIAERQITLGKSVDGSSKTIASQSQVAPLPAGFLNDDSAVQNIADRLLGVIASLRKAIEASGDPDPVTQDLLIGVAGPLEKHLWMLQSQLS